MEAQVDEALRMLVLAEEVRQTSSAYPEAQRPFVDQLLTLGGMTRLHNQTDGWAHGSYQEMVFDLADGVHEAQLTLPEDIRAGTIRECFRNAALLAMDRDDLTYVEGYAYAGLLVVNHAWVVDGDGRIIDPTWAALRGTDHVPETCIYMGVRFSTEYLMELVHEVAMYGVFESDWMRRTRALRLGFKMEDGIAVGDGAEESEI